MIRGTFSPTAEAAMAQATAQPDDRTLVITERSQAADGVVALTLARPRGGRLPDWTPGAHIDLVLPDGTIRQYSLCGDRWDAHAYRIAVRREPDGPDGPGASGWIHDRLRPGDLVGMGGPRNNFPLVPAGRYLFIAGGIGITPLLPMVVQASLLGADWTLLYAGRTRASMAFVHELSGLDEPSGPGERSGQPNRVRVFAGDAGRRLDLGAWLAEPRQDVAVYCCGPDRLLAEVRARCAAWPRHALRIERFTPAPAPAAAGGPFEVELARTGATVSVRPGMSVLDAVLDAGASVLSSCRRGLCGTCEVTVLDGRPDHRDSLLDDDERVGGDSMFICVSRSAGGRLVLDL
jgi:ferredoxin-NADP reductase